MVPACASIDATIGSSPVERGGPFQAATFVSTPAYQEGAAFLVADEVPADLFRRHLCVVQLTRDALIYIAYDAKQKALRCRG
jgi:hypothetical protein